MKKKNNRTENGFTLIELMVAMVIALIVMGSIFMTFKSQQDSYVIQDQVTRMQQNLRGSMYVMTRDIQMAGYYTNFDSGSCSTDWDDDGNTESVRPLIYGCNNISSNGDSIVIIKACHERDSSGNLIDSGTLASGNTATGNTITLSTLDLDGVGGADLNATGKKFGLLVKSDLGKADIFEVDSIVGNTITTKEALHEGYTQGDRIFRADVVIYKVQVNAGRPCLVRKNLGSDNGFQVVAEDIDSLQVQYRLNDGTWVTGDDGTGSFIPDMYKVQAVEVSLLARTAHTIRGYTDPNTYNLAGQTVTPNDGYRRKALTSVIEARNIGL
ncbi:MAG: PilW family protein [Deltaproteobacteria bacterium]|nr:PilW family protein [Deltaproteobacteria bacterium]MBW2344736.1 PilW family protein [Deltaproteobacteria bacterium]